MVQIRDKNVSSPPPLFPSSLLPPSSSPLNDDHEHGFIKEVWIMMHLKSLEKKLLECHSLS